MPHIFLVCFGYGCLCFFAVRAVKYHKSTAILYLMLISEQKHINRHKPHLRKAVDVIAILRLILDSTGTYFCETYDSVINLERSLAFGLQIARKEHGFGPPWNIIVANGWYKF